MVSFRTLRIATGMLVAGLAAAQPAFAANYPLELTNIKPAGTGGLTANNRIYRAYPGLEYNIRAAVIGGMYPYTFTLTNAPAGMSVDARGVITWSNPQGSASPTLTVRDQEGSQVSASWTITADSASFRFVDAANGNDSNPGTQSAPWRTFQKVYSSATGTQIVYFRAGTYTLAGIPTQAADNSLGEEYISWDGVQRSVMWLGYPGDAKPTLDFEYSGSGNYADGTSVPRLKINGPNLYFDNMRYYRCMTMCFQVNHGGQAGTTFRRNVFDTTGPGIEGGNSAFIMFVAAQGVNSMYTVVQDNDFGRVRAGTANSVLKLYTLIKPLIEDNTIHDVESGSEGVAIKAAIQMYTVRGNRFWNTYHGIGGNQNWYSSADQTRGEILYNTISASGSNSEALHFNLNDVAGETFIYRNTLAGRVVAYNVGPGDGPFRLYNNIIVNSDSGTPAGSHLYYYNVTDASRIMFANNLSGYPADGILDSNLLLTSSYQQYSTTHGSQIPGGSTTLPSAPAAPTNVRVIR